MTPAEELRQAATTIRARAEAATPGPWNTDDKYDDNVVYSDAAAVQLVARTADDGSDTRHIVMWSPPVALAVAALLDATAEGVEVADAIGAARGYITHHPRTEPEWTLARLINRTTT